MSGCRIRGEERLEPVEQSMQAGGDRFRLGVVGGHVVGFTEQMGPAPLQLVRDRRICRPAITDNRPIELLAEHLFDDGTAAALSDGEQRVLAGSERP